MAFAELWLPLIGAGVFIAWAIGAWYGGDKRLAIWLTFTGAVCLLLLGALQWQNSIGSDEKPPPDNPERPWIENPEITAGPLTYDDQGARLGLTAKLINSGRTPAINVVFAPFVYLIGANHMDVIGEQRVFCEKTKERKIRSGLTLFMSRTTTLQDSIPITKDDIDKFSAPIPTPSGKTKRFINVMVVGCIDYMDTTSNLHHQTGFAFIMTEGKDPAQTITLTIPAHGSAPISMAPGDTFAISPDNGNIPIGRLSLSPWSGGGFFAN